MTFDELPTSYPDGFPYKKLLDANRFAYVVPLLLGRARIVTTTLDDLLYIDDVF